MPLWSTRPTSLACRASSRPHSTRWYAVVFCQTHRLAASGCGGAQSQSGVILLQPSSFSVVLTLTDVAAGDGCQAHGGAGPEAAAADWRRHHLQDAHRRQNRHPVLRCLTASRQPKPYITVRLLCDLCLTCKDPSMALHSPCQLLHPRPHVLLSQCMSTVPLFACCQSAMQARWCMCWMPAVACRWRRLCWTKRAAWALWRCGVSAHTACPALQVGQSP